MVGLTPPGQARQYARARPHPSMDNTTGKLTFILIAAVLLATFGARMLAWRYRVVMRRLMSAPGAAQRPAATLARGCRALAATGAGHADRQPSHDSASDDRADH